MREPVPPRHVVVLDRVSGDGLVQQVEHLIGVGTGNLGEQIQIELAACDGGDGEQAAYVVPKPCQPQPQHVLYAVRHSNLTGTCRVEPPFGAEEADEFHDEERIAVRTLRDDGGEFLVDRTIGDAPDQIAHVVHPEPSQWHAYGGQPSE